MSQRSSSLKRKSEKTAGDPEQKIDDGIMGTRRKNTWTIFGKNLPRWINPRGRNKEKVKETGKVKYMARMNEKLPSN